MTRQKGTVRILINGMHAKSGGGLTYLKSALPELAADSSLELHLFLHRDQLELIEPIDERVRVHLFDFPGGVLRLLLWEQLALPVLARSMRAQVTLSPANYGPLAAPGSVIVLRNSLAVVGRETRISKRLYWLALAVMTAMSLFACRRAISVSAYARRALTFGMGRWLGDRVAIVHHGVSGFFSPPAIGHERKSFLLVVADLYIQKNLHTLIVAMDRLRRKVPGIALRIAGKPVDPGYVAELQRIVADRELQDCVHFVGSLDVWALRQHYQDCLMLVFPSTVETFGNPLVEAMACGAPIACSNRAAMPEIVGDAAVYFDPLSPDDIENAIVRLLSDPALRHDLSRRGIQRARNFSWQKTAAATAEVLKSAALNRPAS